MAYTAEFKYEGQHKPSLIVGVEGKFSLAGVIIDTLEQADYGHTPLVEQIIINPNATL